ncbi:SgcJ/EcaC family oxidoreductase [Parasphingopyxis sp.]|uniref:YybH family protein n=1 Tax=Parasphingopyxis sp. TaxID=1920299 RepID=UPI00260F9D1E|nr:SgcJ/EcaC family oxidoreductase [Parasphingopyxis sp.]
MRTGAIGAAALAAAMIAAPASAEDYGWADDYRAQAERDGCPGVFDDQGHGPDIGTAEYEAACQYQRDLSAVRAHTARWQALYEAGDFDAMVDLYTPDAILMTAGQPRRDGPEAILAPFRASYAAGWRSTIDFLEEELAIDGDRADLIAPFWMTIQPPGEGAEPIEAMGRSWLTFQRGADGEWRLWRDMDNRAPDVTAEMRPARAE